jgi:hypothetical protein
LLLSAPVVLAAAGAGLPWAHNRLVGERSGLTVLFRDRASMPATLVLLGALMVVLAGVVAAMAYRRRMFAWAATVGALTALSCVSWYGIRITRERVRAIGMDRAGNPHRAGGGQPPWHRLVSHRCRASDTGCVRDRPHATCPQHLLTGGPTRRACAR